MPPFVDMPPNTRCSRQGCEGFVKKMMEGHKPFCGPACRILTRTAGDIMNCRRVPSGRDHAADVATIMRLFPVGSAATVTLSDEDWRELIKLRDAYRRGPSRRN